MIFEPSGHLNRLFMPRLKRSLKSNCATTWAVCPGFLHFAPLALCQIISIVDIDHASDDNNRTESFMKNKYQVVPQNATTKKPEKAEVSDEEFRRRLKNIA